MRHLFSILIWVDGSRCFKIPTTLEYGRRERLARPQLVYLLLEKLQGFMPYVETESGQAIKFVIQRCAFHDQLFNDTLEKLLVIFDPGQEPLCDGHHRSLVISWLNSP